MSLRFLTGGESHGPSLVGILEGMPAGLCLSEADIDNELARRQKGYRRGERMKIEQDRVQILGGVKNGKTIGSPISLLIENRDWLNWKDKKLEPITVPRPGHADFAGALKYKFKDIKYVLERASARETAMRVAIGACAKKFLNEFKIRVISHTIEIGGIGISLESVNFSYEELLLRTEKSSVRCIDSEAEKNMCRKIDEAKKEGNTLGGVLEVIAFNVPPGLGSYVQWDRRLDSRLAFALMSIPTCKAVEIGEGIESSRKTGGEVHDEIFYDAKRGFYHKTNKAGGIEGGVSNGEKIIARLYLKPISSLMKHLSSVDLITKEAKPAPYQRSDICIVPSAGVIAEASVAFELSSAFLEKFGGDSMEEIIRCFQNNS